MGHDGKTGFWQDQEWKIRQQDAVIQREDRVDDALGLPREEPIGVAISQHRAENRRIRCCDFFICSCGAS